MLLPSGNPFKCQEVLYLQSMILPNRFDIFPPDWGISSEGLDAFRFFLKDGIFVLEYARIGRKRLIIRDV